jgi:hypothetical protein
MACFLSYLVGVRGAGLAPRVVRLRAPRGLSIRLDAWPLITSAVPRETRATGAAPSARKRPETQAKDADEAAGGAGSGAGAGREKLSERIGVYLKG